MWLAKTKKARNHLVYAKDESLGCFSLSVNPDFEDEENTKTNFVPEIKAPQISKGDVINRWKLYFDGAYSKEGSGAGVILISPEGTILPFSHKLAFDATNNVAEYEALALGLEKARRMNIKNISIYGDSELIVQQINKVYQTKHPRMRSYRNHV